MSIKKVISRFLGFSTNKPNTLNDVKPENERPTYFDKSEINKLVMQHCNKAGKIPKSVNNYLKIWT